MSDNLEAVIVIACGYVLGRILIGLFNILAGAMK